MVSFPLFICQISPNCGIKIVLCLTQIQNRNVIATQRQQFSLYSSLHQMRRCSCTGSNSLCYFAGHHPPPNFRFSHLLLLPVDGLRAETNTSFVEFPRDEYSFPSGKQMVRVHIVLGPQRVGWNSISKGQRRYGIMRRVKKVQDVICCFDSILPAFLQSILLFAGRRISWRLFVR